MLSFETVLEIEHVFARNRQLNEKSLTNPRNLEALGNKALLEKRINIRAADYKFPDKVKYYVGFENAHKKWKEGTKIKELRDLAKQTDFTESDIVQRTSRIILEFTKYMDSQGLIRK